MSPNSWFSQPVYIPGGDPENMNEPVLQYGGQLGTRFSYINPPRTQVVAGSEDGMPKTFKLVKTDSTMAVAPYDGAVAWYANQAQHLVTTTVATLGRGRVAGVFKNNVTPGYFTCVQVKGIGKVKFIDAPTSTPDETGKFVVGSATNGKADCLAAGTAALYPALGRTAGTFNAAAVECLVDLDVPEVL